MQSRAIDHFIIRAIVIAAPLACLLGGLPFWLRRVGWLQHEEYFEAYWSAVHATRDMQEHTEFPALVARVHEIGASLHQLDTLGWLLTKGWKELVWLLLLAGILWNIRSIKLSEVRGSFAFAALGLLTGWSAFRAVLQESLTAVAAGLRASGWWVLAALAPRGWPEQLMPSLSRSFVWVLIFQALLIPWEMNFGLYMYWMHVGEVLFARPVGTFSLPASLAGFCVVAWTMALVWGRFSRREQLGLSLLTLLIVFVNASGIGWAAFFGSLATIGYLRLASNRRWIILLIAGIGAIGGWVALPELTGRYDLHDSVWGRILPVTEYASRHLTAVEVLIGHQFGAGSNVQVNAPQPPGEMVGLGDRPVGDSLPAALLWKIGALGLLATYLLFVLALLRDPRNAPVGIALGLCSLTINIAEHFPLNLILGLWLAQSLRNDTKT